MHAFFDAAFSCHPVFVPATDRPAAKSRTPRCKRRDMMLALAPIKPYKATGYDDAGGGIVCLGACSAISADKVPVSARKWDSARLSSAC